MKERMNDESKETHLCRCYEITGKAVNFLSLGYDGSKDMFLARLQIDFVRVFLNTNDLAL